MQTKENADAALLRRDQSAGRVDIRLRPRAVRGGRAGPDQTSSAAALPPSPALNDFAPPVPALIAAGARPELSPRHRKALERAHAQLEGQSLAMRLAEVAGQPIDCVLGMMPKFATSGLNRVVEAAVFSCLKLAIGLIAPASRRRPATKLASWLVGLSGGVSGFFGFVALPFELPVTTTLMLRVIAQIARHNGEDLSKLEARLACLEVFALGAGKSPKRLDVGYYAARALLSRLAGQAFPLLLESGVASISAPLVSRLLAAIVSRFGIIVSERVAAAALPVIGAVGGAAVNVVFMNHFQRIAHGHFTIRRLERHYGADAVRRHYLNLSAPRDAAGT
jgi:hypothetical protein